MWLYCGNNYYICTIDNGIMEKNTLMSHEIVMASSDKVTNKFITKMKKEGRIVKIARKIYTTNLNDTPKISFVGIFSIF